MIDLLQDLASITTVDIETLKKISNAANVIITSSVYENSLSAENVTELDIGIGTLFIYKDDRVVRYKFIPSTDLENEILYAFSHNQDPLQKKEEQLVVHRLKDIFKEII